MNDERIFPKRPIAAVSAFVFNNSNEILIVRRAKDPGRGLWSIPGGAVETGETLIDALQREIHEECGITIKIEKFYGAHDRILRDRSGKLNFHYIILNYICRTKNKIVKPGSDVDDYFWLKPSDLKRFKYTIGLENHLIDLFKLKID